MVRVVVLSYLRPFAKAQLELLQRIQTKLEHLGVGGLAQRLEHVAQRHAEHLERDQLVLDQATEQDAGDAQLLVWILGKEAILVEQVA